MEINKGDTYITVRGSSSCITMISVGGCGRKVLQTLPVKDIRHVDIDTRKNDEKTLCINSEDDIPESISKTRVLALKSSDAICQTIGEGTDTVLVIAGMGGLTGTGAASVVAQLARKMGHPTIGIVSTPFRFEGKQKISDALAGVKAMESSCDILLVLDDNRLIDYFSDLTFGNAFDKAEEIFSRMICAVTETTARQKTYDLRTDNFPKDISSWGGFLPITIGRMIT